MLTNELVDLIVKIQNHQAEFQTIEVKSAHDNCPKKLYDTLSSFSNQDSGGVIVFGLDEEKGFSLSDVYDLQDLQKQVTNQCQQMSPPVRAVFTFAEIEGKKVAAAEIPAIELAQRPCYYVGKGQYKGSYIRVGEADLPMTGYEVYSYEAFRTHTHDDERPVERASLVMMDLNKVEQYVQDNKVGHPKFALLSEDQAYEMLNITRNGVPTLAAVMNFGLFPQGYFPQLSITAVVVPGTQIGDLGTEKERFIDNKRIDGTIAEMVDSAVNFCRRNMKAKTIVDSKTGKREDTTEYPITALREAILNALIHRDYSSYTEGTPVQVDMFSDRVEVHSPGGLYGRLTVDQLGKSKPDLRNPALAVMTESQTEAENRYSGIPTMRREMAAYGLPEPVFENRRNEFVVRFYNTKNRANTAGGQINRDDGPSMHGRHTLEAAKDILMEFCITPRTRKEIADRLGLKTVFYVGTRYIQPLIEDGLLFMTIPDKPQSKYQKYYSVPAEQDGV